MNTEKTFDYKIKRNEDSTSVILTPTSDASENQETITESYVTPEMFGAAGDGVTDDSQAIQNMFNSGKLCLIPNKTYAIHGIKVGKNTRIIGNNSTFIFNYLNGNVSNPVNTYILYNQDSANNSVYISGCNFIGQKDSIINYEDYEVIRGSLLVFSNFENVKIENCTVEDSYMDGMFLTDCKKISLSGCTFRRNGIRKVANVGTYNALTVYNTALSVNIENCDFSECWDEAIRADGYDNLCVNGCRFSNIGQYILELFPSKDKCKTEFVGNKVTGTGGTCIGIPSSAADSELLIVKNNIFSGVGGYTDTHSSEISVDIISANVKEESKCIFSDNLAEIITESCKHAFYMQKFGNVTITGNTIKLINNPVNNTLISVPGTHALTLENNTLESTSQNYAVNLYNAAQDFCLMCNNNKIVNSKHLVYLPNAANTVGTVKSLCVNNNLTDSSDSLINVVVAEGKEKVECINAAGNQCTSILKIAGRGAKKFFAVGNVCSQTVSSGSNLIEKICEAANSNV